VRRHPLAPSRVVEASEGHVEESAVNQWQDLTPNFELLHLEHGGTTDQVPGSEEK